jgi:cytochrome b6-f complex iron-sulfur subunit
MSGSAASLWRYLTPRTRPSARALISVARGEIPPQGALVYREARVALVHSGDEVYALSLICTHLGCTVNVGADRLSCPCHGSLFDKRGNVLQGPADRPLRRLKTQQRGNLIEVMAG